MIYYITGGERSGKSRYAQQLALESSDNPVYIATARNWDGDFQKRIERHQKERGLRDFVWAIAMQFRFVVAAAGCRSGSSSGDSLHRAARSTAVG